MPPAFLPFRFSFDEFSLDSAQTLGQKSEASVKIRFFPVFPRERFVLPKQFRCFFQRPFHCSSWLHFLAVQTSSIGAKTVSLRPIAKGICLRFLRRVQMPKCKICVKNFTFPACKLKIGMMESDPARLVRRNSLWQKQLTVNADYARQQYPDFGNAKAGEKRVKPLILAAMGLNSTPFTVWCDALVSVGLLVFAVFKRLGGQT